MEQQLFRKESMERVSSPEILRDYLHVTSPAIWVVLAAVILLKSLRMEQRDSRGELRGGRCGGARRCTDPAL